MCKLSLGALTYISPSPIYVIILKGNWLSFHICTLVEGNPCKIFTHDEIFQVYTTYHEDDKNLMSEL